MSISFPLLSTMFILNASSSSHMTSQDQFLIIENQDGTRRSKVELQWLEASQMCRSEAGKL